MKKSKEEIDQLITESLNKEEAEFYKNLEEEGLFGMITGLYNGKLSWVVIASTIVHILALAVTIYCTYYLFTVESTGKMIQYGAVMFLAMSFAVMTKLSQWMQMYTNSVIRELKRLEYQVAVLMEETRDNRES